MKSARPATTDLEVTRTIPASPSAVYDVWLDKNSPGGPWFGAKKSMLDAKVDGLFFTMAEHEGREYPHYGRFLELSRPHKIAHTWVSESTRGLESIVTLTFEADGAKTKVTLRHTGVPDDEAGRGHKDGWDWVLGCIVERFSK